MFIVLTTLNGWDLVQQGTMRKAAIQAGLVKEERAHQLLDFVTEGEASVHYALAYSQSESWLFRARFLPSSTPGDQRWTALCIRAHQQIRKYFSKKCVPASVYRYIHPSYFSTA